MGDADDEQKPVTVFDRLTRAGLSAERVERWRAQGGVRVDGEIVTDANTPADPPTRLVLQS